MKTMADLIAESNHDPVARALKITGPVLSGDYVLSCNSVGDQVYVSSPAYYEALGVLPERIRPADQVPIPAEFFLPAEVDVVRLAALKWQAFEHPDGGLTLVAFEPAMFDPTGPDPPSKSWRDRPPLL